MNALPLIRQARGISRRLREARMLIEAFKFPQRPVAAHLVPIRRCNLACTYCNEYDDHSSAVATSEVLRRIDLLAALHTGIVTLSGGEPLLHPDLDEIIRHIRRRRMIATIITNGYLLTRDRITRLNRARLDHLQISIDNVNPDEVSKKSLKVLDKKMQWLADCAEFDVTINAVIGGGTRYPDDALDIARRARALGFATTVGIIHDRRGQLLRLDEHQRRVLEAVVHMGKSAFNFASYNRFQKNLAEGRPNQWHCRAGCRYLYVCEDGLVHWCSQQRGYPGIPLERYGTEDLRREYDSVKNCAPWCTVGCVHRVAQLDELRENPLETLLQSFAGAQAGGIPHVSLPVRLLMWAFVTSSRRNLFRKAMARAFGVR
jgi:MoaA/NifB/PqqE/SkfB family radical SAM enzyme